jgi:hypothetical protein
LYSLISCLFVVNWNPIVDVFSTSKTLFN